MRGSPVFSGYENEHLRHVLIWVLEFFSEVVFSIPHSSYPNEELGKLRAAMQTDSCADSFIRNSIRKG